MPFLRPTLQFLARHFFWVFASMILGGILWTLAFLGLIIASVCNLTDVSKFPAFPVGILWVIFACAIIGWGIFTPACALGTSLCLALRINRLISIPIVFIAAYFLSVAWYWLISHAGTNVPMPPWGVLLQKFSLYLSLPLSLYWCITEGPEALLLLIQRWTGRLQKKSANPNP